MSPILYALLAVCFRSTSDIFYRVAMQTRLDPLVTATWNSLIGGLALLLVLGWPEFHTLRFEEFGLLLIAGTFWALQVVFHIKSYQGLGASLNAVLDLGRFVLLNVAGIFLFSEATSFIAVIGLLLIAASIIYSVRGSFEGTREGVLYRLGSVLSGTIALIVEKYLSYSVPYDTIILAGFWIPIVLYLFWRPRIVSDLIPSLRKSTMHLVVTSFLYAGAATFLTYAFGSGALSITMTIYQSSFVLTFLLSIVILREVSFLKRRVLSAAICVVGVLLVCLF